MNKFGLPRSRRVPSPPKSRGRTRYKYSVYNNLLRFMANPSIVPHFRLAVAASKSCGPAVLRNRLKRFAREALRLIQSDLKPRTDYLLILTPGSPKKKSDNSISYKNLRFTDLQSMIPALLSRLHDKMSHGS